MGIIMSSILKAMLRPESRYSMTARHQQPIALGFHRYNRCELWQCRQCAHPFLLYTEYGGYHEDRRIRNLNPALIF
jgi:hypothetical protein